VNAWVWSTVFHARDVLWTERMDYFGADLFVLVACSSAIIRLLIVTFFYFT
jgi:hypothetical protein